MSEKTKELDLSKSYSQHPIAKFIPSMLDFELSSLEEDCLLNGIRNPIIMYGGMILDGWNRYNIAKKHLLKLECKEFEGNDIGAINYCVSVSLPGRKMCEDRRTATAILFKETKKSYLISNNEKGWKIKSERLAKENHIIAKLFGIKEKNIQMGDRIYRHHRGRFKELFNGKTSVKSLYRELFKSEVKKRAIFPSGEPSDNKDPISNYISIEGRDKILKDFCLANNCTYEMRYVPSIGYQARFFIDELKKEEFSSYIGCSEEITAIKLAMTKSGFDTNHGNDKKTNNQYYEFQEMIG